MADHCPTVGIKYCGGCNPRFDRTAFVARLSAAVPAAVFQPARPGESCDLLLVVCGCTARCADTTGLEGRLGRLTVCSGEDYPAAETFLRTRLGP